MTPPVSTKSFPVCSNDDFQKLAKPIDLNGDGKLDRVRVDSKTYQVSVSFNSGPNAFSPWVTRLLSTDSRFSSLSLWGNSLSQYFAAPLDSSLVALLKGKLSKDAQEQELFLSGIRELVFEIADEAGTASCTLGLRVFGTAPGNQAVNFFIPISEEGFPPNIYRIRMEKNPYYPLLEKMRDRDAEVIVNPYRSSRKKSNKPRRSSVSPPEAKLDWRNPYR